MRFRGLVTIITAGAVVVSSAGSARAGTQQDTFERKVAKSAIVVGEPSEGICLCQDGGAAHGLAGFLIRRTTRRVIAVNGFERDVIEVDGVVPAFTDGVQADLSHCPVFIVLSR
jgi:hypothetical protein